MCSLYLQHISFWAVHISRAQEPHVSGSCCKGQHSSRVYLLVS